MKLPVYKSLDKKSSLFGIQGSYLYLIVGGFVIAVVLGFGVVGSAVGNSFIGTGATLLFAAIVYFIVITIQGSYSERELTRKITSFKLPDYMLVRSRFTRTAARSRQEFKKRNSKDSSATRQSPTNEFVGLSQGLQNKLRLISPSDEA